MNTSKSFNIAAGICAVLTLCGIGAWIFQLMGGLGVTGMNNATSWGLYISMFMLFVGLSAGGLIVASSAHVFDIEPFKKVAIPAVICSIVCISAAGMFVLIDLGGLYRIWRIFVGPNFTSPLLWDICVITTYLAINILDLYFLVKGRERAINIMSKIALPIAILVHSVTAWIFGLQIAKAWYTAIMAPIFVASACDSGLALLLIVLAVLHGLGIFRVDTALWKNLARLLAVFVCVDAFFIGCEVLTMAYPGAHEAVALGHMLTGETAPFFWFEIIGGLLIPFLILASGARREKFGPVVLASALIVLGVVAKRLWLLFTSFITPNVEGASGITLGTRAAQADPAQMWTLIGTYAPTAVEITVVIGVMALCILVGMFLVKTFVKKSVEG